MKLNKRKIISKEAYGSKIVQNRTFFVLFVNTFENKYLYVSGHFLNYLRTTLALLDKKMFHKYLIIN
ncbi:MAG: hypothetical protein MUE85_02800 [Microscillaceae bacterium]|jgi:hypothetical protein|nr:hypothetical protein [Microscillaceae bacterium]